MANFSRLIRSLASSIRLSHLLTLSVDSVSRCVIVLVMDSDTSASFLRAYESARDKLASLLQQQEEIQSEITHLRALIESLEKHLKVTSDPVAKEMLESMSLADEIREVLKSRYPAWFRPLEVKNELERIGVDLGKYNNPQSTVQMVLKRMAESQKDPTQQSSDKNGKIVYRCPGVWKSIAEVIEKRSRKK